MRSVFLCTAFVMASAISSFSQLPATGIWMTNITLSGGKMNVTKPVSISGKNSYNDEPVFSFDGKVILYTSFSDSLGHTEIYKYQSKTKNSVLFTSSAESKHAPAIMPDGKQVSFIVSEASGSKRLWKMPLAGGKAELLLKEKDSIGSYCWMSADSVALQVLTSPPSLQAASLSTGIAKVVASNISSCIKRMPSQSPVPGKWESCWIFIEKTKESDHTMESFIYGKKSKLTVMPVCPDCNMLEGAENFCISKAGIFSASGSKIFIFDAESNSAWREIADLSKYGIKNITRITFSPDEKKLLIVSEK